MPRSSSRPSAHPCAVAGCGARALRDSDRCRLHRLDDAPRPAAGDPAGPAEPANAIRTLSHSPTLDDLVANLVDRLAAIDSALAERHELDIKGHALATEIITRIGRLLHAKARASGTDADTVAGLLSKAVDLLFDTTE